MKHLFLDYSFWNGRKVLLTGHTGFKGSWLALWLLELGAKVTGLALAPESNPSLFTQLGLDQRLKHCLGDIRNPDVIKQVVLETKPDIVFHLAAQPLVRLSYLDPITTWSTNVMGTIHLLEALRLLDQPCSAVLITTDKVYRNNEWVYGYRENDPLGGYDPYSSSKSAAEIAIASWRSSFCGSLPHQTNHLRIASARAGNVIGGGDWSLNRIIPDAIRSLTRREPIGVRNPSATRPWQHVLEPLGGYLLLAEKLSGSDMFAKAYNFGPPLEANRTVRELVEHVFCHWPGSWVNQADSKAPHEASLLNLVVDRAHHELGWRPSWNFETTVERTINWYRATQLDKAPPLHCCLEDLSAYSTPISA